MMIILYRFTFLISFFFIIFYCSCTTNKSLENVSKLLTARSKTSISDTTDFFIIILDSEFCGPCLTEINYNLSPLHGDSRKLVIVLKENIKDHERKEMTRKIYDFCSSKEYEVIFIDDDLAKDVRKKMKMSGEPVLIFKDPKGKVKKKVHKQKI